MWVHYGSNVSKNDAWGKVTCSFAPLCYTTLVGSMREKKRQYTNEIHLCQMVTDSNHSEVVWAWRTLTRFDHTHNFLMVQPFIRERSDHHQRSWNVFFYLAYPIWGKAHTRLESLEITPYEPWKKWKKITSQRN